ncbi:MAG TPA: hypothetical protein VF756_21660 [Thermoanaerobaculia bacterium]
MALRIRRISLVLGLPLLLILSHAASGQTRVWTAGYDGGAQDRAGCPRCTTHTYLPFHRDFVRSRNSVAADAAGNVYVTGTSSNGSNPDFVTVKYDANGVRQWASLYDGGEEDQAYAVAVDGGGNVYVTGDSVVQTEDLGLQPRFLTVKYDANGVQQWTATLDSGVWGTAVTVAVDGSGNVHVAGESYNGDSITAMVVKYNAAGAQQWARGAIFGFDYEESSAYDLALDSGGNVYVTGYLYKPFEPDGTDYITAKLSPSGADLWTRAYDSGGPDGAYDVAVDGDGNVFVAGDAGTVKYDTAGVQQWARPFPGTAHALIAAGGFVYATGTSGGDFQTVKYDGAGVQQWAATRDGGGADQAHALLLAGDTLYVTGHTTGAIQTDALTVGFDAASGVEVWSDLYGGAFDDSAYAMASTGTGSFSIAGYSNNGSDNDVLVVQYATSPSPSLPSLLRLKLTPATLAGGRKTGKGRVTLSAPAPAGGAVVLLTNTNPAAVVPASVTIPEGMTSQAFSINTQAVSSTQTGIVTATYGGVSKSETLTVRPVKAKP